MNPYVQSSRPQNWKLYVPNKGERGNVLLSLGCGYRRSVGRWVSSRRKRTGVTRHRTADYQSKIV